jgi:hypothetical protein
MPTIYRKSAKGLTEIETRAHRLTPRLRGVLILVDGRRSDDELRPLVAQQADEALATLLAQGFIEVLAELAQRPAPPPPQPAAVAPAAPARAPAPASAAGGFEAQRRSAVRALNDELGPGAETLAIRMERCRSADELRPLLATAVQTIGNLRGRSAAEAYAARFADV